VRDVGRLSLTLVAVALATILGLAGLAQLKFSAFLSDSIGERLEVVATTAAQDFGSALDLGLGVEEVANGTEILERARSHDPAIIGIAVFDLEGKVLHSVGDMGESGVHPQTSEAFRVVRLDSALDNWTVEADDLIRSGVLIESSFGQPVAGVVVHYPTTEMREQESRMAGALLFDATWIGLTVVLAVALAYLLLRRSGRNRLPNEDVAASADPDAEPEPEPEPDQLVER